MTTKEERRLKIKAGVRGKISGTPERPRLTVFRSNKQIYAQVIDDTTGKTLAAASSLLKLRKKRLLPRLENRLPKLPRKLVYRLLFSTVTVTCITGELKN